MSRKIIFLLIWFSFSIYAFFIAPPAHSNTVELIKNLSLGYWQDINPSIVSLFMLMGVWPSIYACILLVDGKGQKIPAWPFVILGFGLGAFGILPYLALRASNTEWDGNKNKLIGIVESRWLAIALAISGLIFVGLAVTQGDWQDFIQQWQTSKFIHVMSLDFCMLSILFMTLVKDDLARRGEENFLPYLLLTGIPLLGAIAYLCLRPSLEEKKIVEQKAL